MISRCVIWGTGLAGQKMAKDISKMGYEIVAYCSSTKGSQGKKLDNLLVISPENLQQLCFQNKVDCILIAVRKKEFIQQIKERIQRDFPENIRVLDQANTIDRMENEFLVRTRENLSYQWNVDFEAQSKIWIENFMTEVEYWVKSVAYPKGKDHEIYPKRLINDQFASLDKTCDELLKTLKTGSTVMDIGCGLVSKYGKRLPNGEELNLITVDPLAAFYNVINQHYAKQKYTKCDFGMFEFAADFFKENLCDAIMINNALDHCIDPYKSVVECLYVLKPGGIMHLNHHRAEAVYEDYQGLHKWNIDYNDTNDFIIWNQTNSVNVTEKIREYADVSVIHTADFSARAEQDIIIDIVKRSNFPLSNFFDMEQERYLLGSVISGLMHWASQNTGAYWNIP